MKLAVSNIAWDISQDEKVYEILQKMGVQGVEIAPTRIFPVQPYGNVVEAKKWAFFLYEKYGLVIPSMQSIWYGKTEKVFGAAAERQVLLDYTKKAIDFASAIGCRNLVFGSPKNRSMPDGMIENDRTQIEKDFFGELAHYAAWHDTVLSMEANPSIYHTNYITHTEDAASLVKQINHPGFRVNLDIGTVIANSETIYELESVIPYVNHVHISEPGLVLIEQRDIHRELLSSLAKANYTGFISIEMGKRENITDVVQTIEYVKEIMGEI